MIDGVARSFKRCFSLFVVNPELFDLYSSNPVLPLISHPALSTLPKSVFGILEREFRESKNNQVYPSAHGDGLRLGVMWAILSSWIDKPDVVKKVVDVGGLKRMNY